MLVIGLPFIGIFLSIHGYRKSKKAGFHNSLAQIGIWLNAIFVVVMALIIAALVALVVWGFKEGNKQLQQAKDAGVTVQEIQSFAKGFSADNNKSYPDFQTLLNSYADGNAVLSNGVRLVESSDPAPGQVGYEKCVATDGTITGFKLYYADENREEGEPNDPMAFYQVASETIGSCAR